MEIKKKLQRSLVGLGLAGILAISGCGDFTIGGQELVDRRNYVFGPVGDKYANEETEKVKTKYSWDLIDYFMSRGKYAETAEVIDRVFREEGFREGKNCMDRAEELVGFLKTKPKELEFLKEKYKVEKEE